MQKYLCTPVLIEAICTNRGGICTKRCVVRTMRGTTLLLLEAASVPIEEAEVMLSVLLPCLWCCTYLPVCAACQGLD
jgi:hypothetical protein